MQMALKVTVKAGESLHVGDAKITVNRRTKFVIEADKSIKIVRGELVERDLLAGVVQMALEASPKAA
jgi:sRNA-binding carbon storage regulator CsrA